jgi:hypothetical protein
MRIRVIQKPAQQSIDGIQLDRFVPGCQYEVGNVVGAVLLAEGWAEPVTSDEPAVLISVSDFNTRPDDLPANVIREIFPPYFETPSALAADRRRKPRTATKKPTKK